MVDVDRCVLCGEPVPEGRQICKMCELKWEYYEITKHNNYCDGEEDWEK